MKGLGGARVLLVDDEATEAIPVIKALSKTGVPVAYFDGSPTGLPPAAKKLRGVRLAILDMDLGFGGSQENIAATLVKTLESIVSAENGPYGILIWTNHPELKDLAARYVFSRSGLPKPVFVEMIQKASFLRAPPGQPLQFSMTKLLARIVQALTAHSPLECFQVWEGLAAAAAANVTNSVASLPDPSAADLNEWKKQWQEETLRLLLAIAKANAGKHLLEDSCISSLFLALNPLLSDRMELLVKTAHQDLAGHVAGIMSASGSSSIERKARVNAMLHCSVDRLREVSAGNLYVFGKNKRPSFIPTLRDVALDMVDGNDTTKRTANMRALLSSARVCAVELSPECDHAQGNVRLPRLIAGILVPTADVGRLKPRAGFLKTIGPFYFAKTRIFVAGSYSICLSARLVTAAKPVIVGRLRAVVRLRSQLLADIQSWAAYQGSRQGVMLLN